ETATGSAQFGRNERGDSVGHLPRERFRDLPELPHAGEVRDTIDESVQRLPDEVVERETTPRPERAADRVLHPIEQALLLVVRQLGQEIVRGPMDMVLMSGVGRSPEVERLPLIKVRPPVERPVNQLRG